MKNVFLFLLLLFSNFLLSQEFQKSFSSSEIKLKNSAEIPDNLILKVSQDENAFTTVSITENDEEKAKILLKPFSYGLFKAKLVNNIFPTLKSEGVITENYDDTLNENNEAITKLYSDISSYFFTVNERPQVATIVLKQEIPIYFFGKYIHTPQGNKKKRNSISAKTRIGKLKNPVVNISFYSGFIEKIEVTGKLNNNRVTLANDYSIGVSSKKNIEDFSKIRLFSYYKYDITAKKNSSNASPDLSKYESVDKIGDEDFTFRVQRENRADEIRDDYNIAKDNNSKFFVYLNDLISYNRIIDVNANDISPDKQKIVLDSLQRSSKLYREESTKIIEAVVYSDLIGALNDDNPNGTIQTEVNKKFNIKTKRTDFIGRGAGIGMFEYVDAHVMLTKIEEDDKFLLPSNNQFELIDLFQQRNFSVGGLVNWFAYENQNLKINAFYESGIKYSRSGYKLTENGDEENANSIEWIHQFNVHLFPEKRYGLNFRNKLFYYEILDNDTQFLEQLNKKKDWLNVMEVSAYLDIATSVKIFVRYALVHELSDFSNNFERFQIGTSFFFLQKNRKDK